MPHWQPANSDLPASGVTAGTYGDATDSARLTVSAAGLVTAATTVPITGGGGGGDVTQLYANTLLASAPSFDITPISGAYSVLKLIALLRTDGADVFGGSSLIRFNNDAGANYRYQFLQGATATAAAGAGAPVTSGLGPLEIDNNVTASYFGVGELVIPFYANTITFKTAYHTGGEANPSDTDLVRPSTFTWQSTAAITRITVLPSSGTHFIAGSAVVLYGLT